jgi:TusA-related sulfurtransferase
LVSRTTGIAALSVDGGALALGGGLLAILRPALDAVEPGGVVALASSNPGVLEDLPAWCRLERHEYLGCEKSAGHDRHLISRGASGVSRPTSSEPPIEADPHTGFAPRGAQVEPGGPPYPFTLTRRAHAAPPDARALYDQALAAQWSAERDIPWTRVRPLSPAIDRAVAQIMTFLAENELAALYVPSKFVARLHPAYLETALFLSSQLTDEARHIDVFLRRARIAGGPRVSTVTTSRSLLSLLELEDFAEAAFLLSVLGEGTFLDLLRFVEAFAPDEPTAELARRARADEARHVHFGVLHVRAALAGDPGLAERLEAAVRRRAARLSGVAGVPAPIADALTVLAAGSTKPGAIARGHEAFRALLVEMEEGRIKRLVHAGFSPDQARHLSDLHTPNFM